MSNYLNVPNNKSEETGEIETLQSVLSHTNNYREFLRESGSSNQLIVDGSSTPVDFEIEASADETLCVYRIMLIIDDGSRINPQGFAGGSALTNGLLVKLIDTDGTTVLLDYIDGGTIQTNSDFGCLTGPTFLREEGVGFNDSLIIDWKLSDSGAGTRLDPGQRLRIVVQDDLTGIDSFVAISQGTKFLKKT